MSAQPARHCFDIAIVGGGASGVLVAVQLLRKASKPLRIALLEPAPVLARGVAYATNHAEHLLNVPARRMSAFVDRPDDFLDYLLEQPGSAVDRASTARSYAARRSYGPYLRERLQQALASSVATLEVIPHRIVDLEMVDGIKGYELAYESGERLQARQLVLAVGNRPKPLPARGADQLRADAVLNAWEFDAIKAIPADAEVCIVGSGLSMVDSVLSLVTNAHRGSVQVVSRHGLMPLSHATHALADFEVEPLLAMNLPQRVRFLRTAARKAVEAGLPWQAVMERLRPQVPALWQSLSFNDQRRFLRHGVRYWDIHRHRIAPSVHAQLHAMQDSGQLQQQRGRLDTVTPLQGRIRVCKRGHDSQVQAFDVDYLINATGVEMRVQSMRNPLLDQLLGKGLAQAGAHGIGIATDGNGRVLAVPALGSQAIFAMGSLRIGELWESIAVPELRGQAEIIADQLLDAAD